MNNDEMETLSSQLDKHGQPITIDTKLSDLTDDQMPKVWDFVAGQLTLGQTYLLRVKQDLAGGKQPITERRFFDLQAAQYGLEIAPAVIEFGKTTYRELAEMKGISSEGLNEIFVAFGLKPIHDFSLPVDSEYLRQVGLHFKYKDGDECPRCGRRIKTTIYACAYCGYVDWGAISIGGIFSFICLVIIPHAPEIFDPMGTNLWTRNSWMRLGCWGISLFFGVLFLWAIVSSIVIAIRARRSGYQVSGEGVATEGDGHEGTEQVTPLSHATEREISERPEPIRLSDGLGSEQREVVARRSFHIDELKISLELPSFIDPNPRSEKGALVFVTDEENGELEILLHRSMLSSSETAVSTWYLSESSQFRVQIPSEAFQSFQTKLGTAKFIAVRRPGEGERKRVVYHVFIPHCVGSTGIKIGYIGDYDRFEESRCVEINNAIQSLEVAEG